MMTAMRRTGTRAEVPNAESARVAGPTEPKKRALSVSRDC
jgi:hypothetical protein